MTDHEPFGYRTAAQDRWEVPADVCGTCSDFEAGVLVPVSFCPIAQQRSEELYAWLGGYGVRPIWLDSGDAMIMKF